MRKYWTFADVATVNYELMSQHQVGDWASGRSIFHNIRWATPLG
jgi:hypothetical protein